MKKTILHLPLKEIYFRQIQSGEKVEEFREKNAYWTKRLVGRPYDYMLLTLGYPEAGNHERRLLLPYWGYVEKKICHPHFNGGGPVYVYAIDVAHAADFAVI
jgi:hypothetical protein